MLFFQIYTIFCIIFFSSLLLMPIFYSIWAYFYRKNEYAKEVNRVKDYNDRTKNLDLWKTVPSKENYYARRGWPHAGQ